MATTLAWSHRVTTRRTRTTWRPCPQIRPAAAVILTEGHKLAPPLCVCLWEVVKEVAANQPHLDTPRVVTSDFTFRLVHASVRLSFTEVSWTELFCWELWVNIVSRCSFYLYQEDLDLQLQVAVTQPNTSVTAADDCVGTNIFTFLHSLTWLVLFQLQQPTATFTENSVHWLGCTGHANGIEQLLTHSGHTLLLLTWHKKCRFLKQTKELKFNQDINKKKSR